MPQADLQLYAGRPAPKPSQARWRSLRGVNGLGYEQGQRPSPGSAEALTPAAVTTLMLKSPTAPLKVVTVLASRRGF